MLSFALCRRVTAACALLPVFVASSQTLTAARARDVVQIVMTRNVRATLSGVVVDSSARPLAEADVIISTLNLRARTNAEGEFRISDIPAGSHTVVVRRIGFAAIAVSLQFADNEIAFRRFILLPVTLLDSFSVNATRLNPDMIALEDRRRSGFGTFLTRDKLAQFDEESLTRVLPQLPGVRVVRGSGNRAWVASSRHSGALGLEGRRGLLPSDKMSGATSQCYAKIYLNNMQVYSGTNSEPLFDASVLQVKEIEAIEYYAGMAQTPAQYGGAGATCGVMVIWTRKGK